MKYGVPVSAGFIEEVDAKRILPSKRSLRTEVYSLEELAASIAEVGLLEPIVVRPTMGRRFEVVAGNRRFEACKMLGIAKIPCHIVEMDDKEAYLASIIENVQHKSLDPIEEAEAFRKYVGEFGYGGVTDLAKRIGKSPTYVSRRIALLKLPPNAREELLRRRKTPSIAQELLSLAEDDRDIAAKLIIRNEKQITLREVREIIRRVKEKRRTRVEDGDESYLAALSRQADKREYSLGRPLAKSITALRLCMERLDDIYEHVDEKEWVVREVILRCRRLVHRRIDELVHFRQRTMKHPPPLIH